MLSNMNVVMVWVCVLWELCALEHERYSGLSMCAPASGSCGGCKSDLHSYFGQVCSGKFMLLAGRQVVLKIPNMQPALLRNGLLLPFKNLTKFSYIAATFVQKRTEPSGKMKRCGLLLLLLLPLELPC